MLGNENTSTLNIAKERKKDLIKKVNDKAKLLGYLDT
jgi:hypothetical protein